MSRILWGIPIDSDQEWSPVAHSINVAIAQVDASPYKYYWIRVFAGFRYLRFRYIMSASLPEEERKNLRLPTWHNLIVRLNSKRTTQQTMASSAAVPYNDLPVFYPKYCKDYAKNIITILVQDAKTLLGKNNATSEERQIFAEFQAELERDFEKMIRGVAPGPSTGPGINSGHQAEQELAGMMEELQMTEDCMKDMENMMRDMGIEEAQGETTQGLFVRRNAVSEGQEDAPYYA